MRIHRLSVAAFLIALMSGGAARADSEADRLREALRSATAQTRQLEDQRTALQAKVAAADREIAAAKAQTDAAKAQVRQIEKEHREAVDEFNKRLTERDETLEKWKTAYEEAATVARAKDAERAKFEGEAAAFKASTKSCQDKNTQLVNAGREILQRYHKLTLGDALVASEPLTGLGRVGTQNFLQDSTDKILDQKVTP
jgi:chromosome segregation ATPase